MPAFLSSCRGLMMHAANLPEVASWVKRALKAEKASESARQDPLAAPGDLKFQQEQVAETLAGLLSVIGGFPSRSHGLGTGLQLSHRCHTFWPMGRMLWPPPALLLPHCCRLAGSVIGPARQPSSRQGSRTGHAFKTNRTSMQPLGPDTTMPRPLLPACRSRSRRPRGAGHCAG